MKHRCRKARELIPLYVVPDRPWVSSEDRKALETHMALREGCRRACQESQAAVGMLRECWQIGEDIVVFLRDGQEQKRHGVLAGALGLSGFPPGGNLGRGGLLGHARTGKVGCFEPEGRASRRGSLSSFERRGVAASNRNDRRCWLEETSLAPHRRVLSQGGAISHVVEESNV